MKFLSCAVLLVLSSQLGWSAAAPKPSLATAFQKLLATSRERTIKQKTTPVKKHSARQNVSPSSNSQTGQTSRLLEYHPSQIPSIDQVVKATQSRGLSKAVALKLYWEEKMMEKKIKTVQ